MQRETSVVLGYQWEA